MVSGRDLIFCENLWALLCCPRVPNIIYSCHDIDSKLRRLRFNYGGGMQRLRQRLRLSVYGWLEKQTLRRATSILCVSASEAAWIRRWTGRPTQYLPIVADGLTAVRESKLKNSPRYFFYGGSGATANRLMLSHLKSNLLGRIEKHIPGAEFHQIGSCARYNGEQISWLTKHFIVHGFVDNVTSMMRFGDVCLIPYEHDTGFRTKIPELCAMGVIAAGYPVSFACCPEMEDDRNCVMGHNPEELALRLAANHTDSNARKRLANNSVETFRTRFAWPVLQTRYEELLSAF